MHTKRLPRKPRLQVETLERRDTPSAFGGGMVHALATPAPVPISFHGQAAQIGNTRFFPNGIGMFTQALSASTPFGRVTGKLTFFFSLTPLKPPPGPPQPPRFPGSGTVQLTLPQGNINVTIVGAVTPPPIAGASGLFSLTASAGTGLFRQVAVSGALGEVYSRANFSGPFAVVGQVEVSS
jgi:hypothetical protein